MLFNLWEGWDSNPLSFLCIGLRLERCTIPRYFQYFQSNRFLKWFSPLLQSDAHPPSEQPSHVKNFKYVNEHFLVGPPGLEPGMEA